MMEALGQEQQLSKLHGAAEGMLLSSPGFVISGR